VKFGIISARAHLVLAIRNHRKAFRDWGNGGWPDHQTTSMVNNDIGLARRKLNRLGIGGKCNDAAYRSASDMMLNHSRKRSRGRKT